MKKVILCLMLGMVVLGSGCDDDKSTGSTAAPQSIVAIIYESNSGWANDMRSLLSDNGFTTLLLELSEIPTANFSNVNLIIVSPWIGSGYDFGDSAAVDTIKALDKPILGVGPGGARLFQGMDATINWGHCWSSSDTNSTSLSSTHMYVVDPSHSVFTKPNSISIPADSLLEIYTRSAYVAEYKPHLPDSIMYIGRQGEDENHYTLVKEGERYCLWGYTNSPSSMTQAGKDLFINVVHYMIQ